MSRFAGGRWRRSARRASADPPGGRHHRGGAPARRPRESRCVQGTLGFAAGVAFAYGRPGLTCSKEPIHGVVQAPARGVRLATAAPPKKRVRRSRIMSRFVIIRGRGARGAAKATRLRRSAPPGTRSGEAAIFAECEVGRPLPSRGEPIFDVNPECTRASGAAPRPRRICLCGWRVERGCTAREADERTSA